MHADGIGCPSCFADGPDEAWERQGRFDQVAQLVEESHFGVRLESCPGCKQLFVHIFLESIDWQGGNDPQSILVVPVSAAEAQSLRSLDEFGTERAIRSLPPRRCLDAYWPSDGPRDLGWRDGPTLMPHD